MAKKIIFKTEKFIKMGKQSTQIKLGYPRIEYNPYNLTIFSKTAIDPIASLTLIVIQCANRVGYTVKDVEQYDIS